MQDKENCEKQKYCCLFPSLFLSPFIWLEKVAIPLVVKECSKHLLCFYVCVSPQIEIQIIEKQEVVALKWLLKLAIFTHAVGWIQALVTQVKILCVCVSLVIILFNLWIEKVHLSWSRFLCCFLAHTHTHTHVLKRQCRRCCRKFLMLSSTFKCFVFPPFDEHRVNTLG